MNRKKKNTNSGKRKISCNDRKKNMYLAENIKSNQSIFKCFCVRWREPVLAATTGVGTAGAAYQLACSRPAPAVTYQILL